MLRLITNELTKIFKNKLFPCLMVILLLSSIAYAIVLNNYQEKKFYIDDWAQRYNEQITDLEDQINNFRGEEGELVQLEAQMESLKYKLENNISPQHWKSIALSQVNRDKTTLDVMDDEEDVKKLEEKIGKMLRIIEESKWEEFIVDQSEQLFFLLELDLAPIEMDEIRLMLEENQMRLDYGIEPYFGEDPDNWKNTLLRTIFDNKLSVLNSTYKFYDIEHYIPYSEVERIEIQNMIAEYRLKTDNPPIKAKTFSNFILKSSDLIILVIISLIILSAISICNEFSYGTIKRLLVFPYSRWKIITGKYLSITSIGVMMIAFIYIASLVSGLIIYGLGEVNPHIWYFGGKILETNIFIFVALKYAISIIEVVAYIIIAMMLAILFKNAAVSTGLALTFATISNRIISVLYNEYGFGWTKFIIFPNARLTQFLEFNPILPILTFQFSLLITLLNCVAILLLTYYCFCNEEV